MIKIRATRKQDIPAIMAIYEVAKLFMRANGNGSQWANGYPWKELIEEDQARLIQSEEDTKRLFYSFYPLVVWEQ